MRNSYIFMLVGFIWFSCQTKEDFISSNPDLQIIFSNDSVAFDTLLSQNRSSTKRLTVYNPNEEAIIFDQIGLGRGENSDYSLIINGKPTNTLANERLLGGDSMLILVEASIVERNNDVPYLVKDSINFRWNTNQAHVKLVSYGQDGKRIRNQVICDEVWTNDRPYILKDTVLVGAGCSLTIEKGTKLYFENDAALFIQGTLTAIGDSADHITFRNSRFDGIYDQVPGQWNGIYFLEGSQSNEIQYADIYNGQIGLRIGTPDADNEADVVVSNTQIYNMSLAGILAFTSDLDVTNTLIYNCGSYLVGNFAGGNYQYRHCTFSNEPSLFVNDEPSVQFADNILTGNNELISADLNVTLMNCIVWGPSEEELLINNGGNANLTVLLQGNILKSRNEFSGNISTQNFNFPGFLDQYAYDYRLTDESAAIGAAVPIGIDVDLRGAKRDDQPDIGAFEFVPSPE